MKIAFIGASAIAHKILPSIRELPQIQIAGIASEDEHRGREFAKQRSIEYLGSATDALARPEIDAVYLSTSNNRHAAGIEASLVAGKHVLCEKPLVLTGAEAERLFALAAQRKKILLEGLMYRFNPDVAELIRRVRSGVSGRPRRISAKFCFDYGDTPALRRRLQSGGGALPDLGCYLIDFIHQIAGDSPVVEIQSFEQADPLSFSAFLRFESGLTADVQTSMRSSSRNTWEVQCEQASWSIDRFQPHESASALLYHVDGESELSTISIGGNDLSLASFRDEFRNFQRACHGEEEPFILALESIRNAKLLERFSCLQTAKESQ